MTAINPNARADKETPKRVLLAAPRGYCAGVDRAVIAVEKALDHYGAPVYVRKQIVHNKHVVQSLEARGAIFVDEVDEAPEGCVMVFSAHGVAPTVIEAAKARNQRTIDATCPLVTKVHREVIRFANEGYEILLVGHEGHEEVEGTAGEAPHAVKLIDGDKDIESAQVKDPEKVIWLSQTTLSVDETMETVTKLRKRFPLMQNPPRTAPHAGLQAGLAAPIHPDPATAVRLNADRAFRIERMKPTARHPLDMTPPQRSR